MKIKYCILICIILLVLIIYSNLCAANIGRKSPSVQHAEGYFTEQELSSLPDIVEVRTRYYLYERTEELKQKFAPYIKRYGFGYITIHHYGVGQIFLNRVNLDTMMDSQRKAFLLKSAISEFGFVLDPRKDDKYSELFKKTFFPLVLSKRAEAYILSNEISKAIADLYMAIKIKPSYSIAYFMLSKCYQSIGDNENAAKMLQLGNRYKKRKL